MLAKLVFDPTQLPVMSLAGEAAVAPARLSPT
ncbi:MAG: coenzyme A pyrophosphatase, partial [Oxalobacteraceae bacterium]